MTPQSCDVAIIGAGIAGIATAHYLAQQGVTAVVLIDSGQLMALTSAQSGDNYRNWWPHPVMTRFTDDSIDLMERIVCDSDNRILMTRGGYALATRRSQIDDLIAELYRGYGAVADRSIRYHTTGHSSQYKPACPVDWIAAPEGVDVIQDASLIRTAFPWFDPEVANVLHIRRAGDISGQQLGQYMFERFREAGGRSVTAAVVGIDSSGDGFDLNISKGGKIRCSRLVNAAGPFVNEIVRMLGNPLPVQTLLQQKIAFEDTAKAIARDMPFAVDLDAQYIDWSAEDRAVLAEDPVVRWLTKTMPGGIHCRPDGGKRGTWVKLGWAFNRNPSSPSRVPELDRNFPEIVLRGAARLIPALQTYYGRLPRNRVHYGGYYTMTEENWPLIGPTDREGVFVVGALSGFGTMAACQAGRLCADWLSGAPLPDYAPLISLARYDDAAHIRELREQSSKGLL